MEIKKFDITNQPPKPFDWSKLKNSPTLGEAFAERPENYINEFHLFAARFNEVPNFIHEVKIDCNKANKWFIEKYALDIQDYHYTKRYSAIESTTVFDDLLYFLYDDFLINFDISCNIVRFLFRKTEPSKIDEIISGIKKFRKRKSVRKPQLCIIIKGNTGFEVKPLYITRPKLDINDNYNDDFKEIHELVLKRLLKKDDKGLVLLHGKPGTGKTSYIRYLITLLKKEVIFLPSDVAASITEPSVIQILMKSPNCIFVIEDAENILTDRNAKETSPVSALLNISDGLLSDCLSIQIICTFNTDLSKVDNALLRKGRLIASYEFKELAVDKAQQLSNKLKFTTIIQQPTTLTDIYNQNDMAFQQNNERQRIGFGVNR